MAAQSYLAGAIPHPENAIKEFTESGAWLNLTYGDLIDRAASQYPEKIAVISENACVTYAELKENVDKFAIALLKLGVEKYDRIIVQLPNRYEFVVCFYGIQKIGAVPILSVPRHDYREISFFIKLAQPVGWIVPVREGQREFLPLIHKISSEVEGLKHLIMLENGEQLPTNALSMAKLIEGVKLEDYPINYLNKFRPDANDVALLAPTGGTTGLPKMVPCTHNSLIIATKYCSIEMNPDDVALQVTPVGHHLAIRTAIGSAILNGATLVLQKIPQPAEILETIQRERATIFWAVPTQLEDIMNHPDLKKYDVSSLRVFATAGAALPREVAYKAADYFGKFGCRFRGNTLGSSEGHLVGHELDEPLEVKLSTVGRPPIPGSDYKVINEEGQELPPNTEGGLVCKGPEIFTGYYKMTPDERKQVFTPDGYFMTGDLVKTDERGYITVSGRKKDVIMRGGETLVPSEIEAMVRQHPSVGQVAVIGMPDARLGERICAYVVLKPGKTLTFDELAKFLKFQGASVLLLPERLEIVNELPLTAIGKVDKKALRKDIEEKLGGSLAT